LFDEKTKGRKYRFRVPLKVDWHKKVQSTIWTANVFSDRPFKSYDC
jgi:hypothetical protein